MDTRCRWVEVQFSAASQTAVVQICRHTLSTRQHNVQFTHCCYQLLATSSSSSSSSIIDHHQPSSISNHHHHHQQQQQQHPSLSVSQRLRFLLKFWHYINLYVCIGRFFVAYQNLPGRCLVCKHGSHVINMPKADWPGVKNKQLTATP